MAKKEVAVSPWQKLLGQYFGFSRSFDIDVPPGATDEDIRQLDESARLLDLHVVPEFYELLRISNGTSFDGLRFFGANIDDDDEAGRIDFATTNDLVEERGEDTLYGAWNDEFFVGVRATGGFERRSKVTGDAYESYSSFADLLKAVLEEECELLEKRFGGQGS